MRLLIILNTFLALTNAYLHLPAYEYRGPTAPISSEGMVMDTPEVAHARAKHLALHAETVAKMRQAEIEEEEYERKRYVDESSMSYEHSPTPATMMTRPRQRSYAPLGHDGRVVDTPEVARAKAAHLALHARAMAKTTSTSAHYNKYDAYDSRRNLLFFTPIGLAYTQIPSTGYRGLEAPLGPDGRVMDTPEVTRAREAHMKAHAHAMALTANYY